MDLAGIFGRIDDAELVGPGGLRIQIGGENGLAQGLHDVFGKGLLFVGVDGVDIAEPQPEQAVAVSVGDERAGDFLGELDALLVHGHAAHLDYVESNVTLGAAAVAVGDVPTTAFVVTPGRALGWVESGVRPAVFRREFCAEHPPVMMSVRWTIDVSHV